MNLEIFKVTLKSNALLLSPFSVDHGLEDPGSMGGDPSVDIRVGYGAPDT